MADQFKTDNFHLERVMLEFIEAEVLARIKEFPISLEINENMIDITGIEYTEEEIKVKSVYHNQPGFFYGPDSYGPMERKRIK